MENIAGGFGGNIQGEKRAFGILKINSVETSRTSLIRPIIDSACTVQYTLAGGEIWAK
ncbi:hypothetical protein [Desulfatibacillum aliphaticivorans]|uniref:hypothetical protein n=1 Tax=Desulfatibacillum aliphaticivorans TaxID=218208 RepID=UPI00143B3B82|nr:hypothetical protein [Desulfatibacillum aliphaticivorans]